MKRILSIFVSLIFLSASAQTQTYFGTKTFNSPPKFKNLVQNNLNAKVLTINSLDGLQWRDASTFVSPTPNFQQITNGVGNGFTSNNFSLVDGVNPLVEVKKLGDFGSVYVFNPVTEDQAKVIPQNVSTSNGVNGHTVQLNVSGTSESGLGVNTNGNGYTTWFKSNDISQNVYLQSPKTSGRLGLERPYKVYSGRFQITNNSGLYIFTLVDTYEGNFTGFTFTTQQGPDRFNMIAPSGTFANKNVSYVDLQNNGQRTVYGSIQHVLASDIITITEVYQSTANGNTMTYQVVPTGGQPKYIELEIRVKN